MHIYQRGDTNRNPNTYTHCAVSSKARFENLQVIDRFDGNMHNDIAYFKNNPGSQCAMSSWES